MYHCLSTVGWKDITTLHTARAVCSETEKLKPERFFQRPKNLKSLTPLLAKGQQPIHTANRLNETHLNINVFLVLVTGGRDHEIPGYISGIAGIYCQLVHSMLPTTSSRQQKHNPLIIHQKETNSCKLFDSSGPKKKRTLQIIIVQVPSLTPENLKFWNTSQTFYKSTYHGGLWRPLPQPATTRNHPIKEKCSILT